MAARRVFIIPGNGGGDTLAANWYRWARDQINKLGVECVVKNMPDPVGAKMSIWLPFMENDLKIGESDIIIGHSSGACAAIRFAEKHKVHGIILVSAYVSDLGDENERESGYFDHPWLWQQAMDNCNNIVLFGSTDDPFLPWSEQKQVADSLQAKLKKFEDRGHFMTRAFPELVSEVKALC